MNEIYLCVVMELLHSSPCVFCEIGTEITSNDYLED
jgi:hypothetical protein